MQKNSLPEPDSHSLDQCDRVVGAIQSVILEEGPISFEQYMSIALYAPGLGYYTAGSSKIGESGDFITAPEISPLFSGCVARQCEQVLRSLGGGSILELGAGTGAMALAILQELECAGCLPTHYYILEVSADLKARQQTLLHDFIPQLYERVVWLDSLELEHFNGVVLGNEVLDAMPVEIFKIDNGIKSFYVDCKEGEFEWVLEEAPERLIQHVEALGVEFSNGYQSEINCALKPWIRSLSEIMNSGIILLMDYGFPQHEYYHHDRHMGTLMCHFRHHAHADPLILPGIQDITAHVDFTAVAQAAVDNDLDVAGYTHQAAFLINCGIANMLEQITDDEERFKANQQVKKLTLPSEMGELFKVIALTKRFDEPLLGFSAMDQLARL